MEVLGRELTYKLLDKCNWSYSKPTEEEEKEAERLIESKTVEDKPTVFK